MTFRILCIIGLSVFSLVCPALAQTHKAWQIKAGVGYEFLSQEYFIDSLQQNPSADQLDLVTALTTTYLDDVRGQLALHYRPRADRRIDLGASYEQTPDLGRYRFTSDLRPKFGASRLIWVGELDVRNSYRDHPKPGDSYVTGKGSVKLMLPATGRSEFWGQVRAGRDLLVETVCLG